MEVSRHDLLVAYKDVFGTTEGQIVLADLVRTFGFTTRTTRVDGDPQKSTAQEGQREVIVHIAKALEAPLDQTEEQKTEMGK